MTNDSVRYFFSTLNALSKPFSAKISVILSSAFSALPLHMSQQKATSAPLTVIFVAASTASPVNGQATCLACFVATSWWLALAANLAVSALNAFGQFMQQKKTLPPL